MNPEELRRQAQAQRQHYDTYQDAQQRASALKDARLAAEQRASQESYHERRKVHPLIAERMRVLLTKAAI